MTQATLMLPFGARISAEGDCAFEADRKLREALNYAILMNEIEIMRLQRANSQILSAIRDRRVSYDDISVSVVESDLPVSVRV